MKPKWNGIKRRKSLRTQAEGLVRSVSTEANAPHPTAALMHELLVHKVELEMQNEELRRANIEMEEARDHYRDLYELAPIGYITINEKGVINAINLTGAALLGMDRTKLINRRFSTFVANTDKDRWHLLLMNMMKHAENEQEQQSFSLQLRRADGFQFAGNLHCLRKNALNELPMLQVALTDLTQHTTMPAPPGS